MKRNLLLLSLSCFLLLSCADSNKGYVRKAVWIMDHQGLYAEGPTWESMKDSVLSLSPNSLEEAQDIVRKALKAAGGKHSFLYISEKVKEDISADWEMPSFAKDNEGIAVIKLPPFSGNKEQEIKYAKTVLDSLSSDIRGVVIDLQGNTGGNMYPMIAAIHPFLPDDNILQFKSRKRTTTISPSYVNRVAGISPKEHIDCPVAILTDSLTASSGEAVLICFRGLGNMRVFGTPTAGYASCNSRFPLPDGSKLILTTGCDVARTGEAFCDDPIAPDVETSNPLEEALKWIREK